MISLNMTGKSSLPSAFLDSSLNIKTDEDRLDINICQHPTHIDTHIHNLSDCIYVIKCMHKWPVSNSSLETHTWKI